ncbi:hypothetical protein EXS73_03670 [Candidatus Pacearchaeota archaeon]|nr:hypothetical protein [Candidatus Pacearchaeota archaeon]
MKKKSLILLGIGIVVIILLGFFLSATYPSVIKVDEGQYFNANGTVLGACKIETKECPLCDLPSFTSYFYDTEGKVVGECKGRDNSGCSSNTKKIPHPCTSELLEETCTDRPYYATRMKYSCIVASP